MKYPAIHSILFGAIGGIANVAVVLSLYFHGRYPILESPAETGVVALTAFLTGFALLLVTAHTRLLTPSIGFLGVLTTTVYLELTSPSPEFHEWHGNIIVEGHTYAASYVNTWYLWLALFLFVGIVEFGIRRGYGIAEGRLRNLPNLPLSWHVLLGFVGGGAGFIGVATMLLVLRSGIRPPAAALIVFLVGVCVAAVPLISLLHRGLLLPTILFGLLVPYSLALEVFVTTDSPVHILLFGPYTVVLATAWLLESRLRSWFRGWDGGRFDSHKTG